MNELELNRLGFSFNEEYQLITVVGPTASGKSDFAIDLAVAMHERGKKAAIINADSYALYRKMDIGTAKVEQSLRNELKAQYQIEHYQIDVLEPNEHSNAAMYQKSTLKIIDQLHQQNITPILCGGSGLYLRVVTDNFEFQKVDLNLRGQLELELKETGIEPLYQKLLELDEKAAKSIDCNNSRRIIRALEVIYSTQKPYQNELPQYSNRFEKTFHFGKSYDLSLIDQRIESRTQKMRENGLTEEVRSLFDNNLLGETAIKAIGYAELVSYFRGEKNPADGRPLTLDTAFLNIANHTKRLVRKQLSWFKRDSRIQWYNVVNCVQAQN